MTTDPRLERACRAVAWVASIGFALAAFWELGDRFGAGHFASAAAVCTSAENMWHWGVLGPVPHELLQPPLPREFYCHHPWGIFWVTAIFMKLFGHHAWACRLPAALQSALTVPALYCAGRSLWSPVAGAVAASSFAVLPIALSFADFNSLEVPVIFGVVLCIWGYARYRQGYQKRFAALSLAGLVYALCCDWAAVIFAALFLGALFVVVFLLGRWSAPADRRRLATFWALAVALCGLALGAHLYVFAQLGQLNELFSQGNLRSTGSNLPLALVLAARKFWIEISFTGLAILLGKLALPVLALRALLRRSDVEALPLAVFGMAAFQYVVFKQGADIHIFWPHYFALYFALSWAGLVQSLLDWGPRLSRQFPRIREGWPAWSALALGVFVPSCIAPDGLRALHYAHRSGGRFNENGHLTKPDKDKAAALEWLSPRMAPGSGVILHSGMRQSLWVDWSLQRPVSTVPRSPAGPVTPRDRYYIGDVRFMSAAEQEALARDFALTAVGPFLAVDRAAPRAELAAFSVQRVEPSLLQAYWVSSSHALRRVVPDPFLAWELRDRFGMSPNQPPSEPPQGFEQLRIAHNIAVARGDTEAAAKYQEQLLRGILRGPTAEFENGDAFLGSRLEDDGSLVLSAYFSAAGPDPSEPELLVHSTISSGAFASLVAKDKLSADVAMPFTIPASRWKGGYIYSSVTEVIRRIGDEVWKATFRPSREAALLVPAREFELVYLE